MIDRVSDKWCARRDYSALTRLAPPGSPCGRSTPPLRGDVVELPGLLPGVRIKRDQYVEASSGAYIAAIWCARRDSNSRPPGS